MAHSIHVCGISRHYVTITDDNNLAFKPLGGVPGIISGS